MDITGETSPVIAYKMLAGDEGKSLQCIGTNAFGSTTSNTVSFGSTAKILTFNGVDSYATIPTSFAVGRGDSLGFILNTTDNYKYISGGGTGVFIQLNGLNINIRWGGTVISFNSLPKFDDGVDHTLLFSCDASGVMNLNLDGTDYSSADVAGTGSSAHYEFGSRQATSSYMAGIIREIEFNIAGTVTKWNVDSGSTTTEEASIGTGTMTFNNVAAVDRDWETLFLG